MLAFGSCLTAPLSFHYLVGLKLKQSQGHTLHFIPIAFQLKENAYIHSHPLSAKKKNRQWCKVPPDKENETKTYYQRVTKFVVI